MRVYLSRPAGGARSPWLHISKWDGIRSECTSFTRGENVLRGVDWATLVNRLTNDVHNAAEGAVADWDLDGVTSVFDALATDQTFGTVHGDATDGVLAKMLCDFEDQANRVILDFEGVEDRWQFYRVAIEWNP